MSVLEIEKKALGLPEEERQMLIFRLQNSLKSNDEEPPDWHGEVLAERLALIESGKGKYYSLEEVKERMVNRSREAKDSK